MNYSSKIAHFFLAALVCLLAVAGAPVAVGDAVPRAQPAVLALAAAQPEALFSVIVQKAGPGTRAEAAVTRLGGRVTQAWHIINAFAAMVPGKAVRELAGSDGVQWVSYDAPVATTACAQCVDTTTLKNAYIQAIHADRVWNNAPYRQGQGIAVAVVDSGINPNGDLYTNLGVNRQVADVRFNTDYNQTATDGYGHGTHVASVIAGDGSESGGQYIGVAPQVNVVNVKVSNDDGSAQTQNVISGLQWVLDHKGQYNIRVVNLSLNSTAADSYRTSPLDAAVEILWFNGIVVVVSAGNAGSSAIYPPANDPFVITVGAVDDKGTASLSDDTMPSFSAYGTTSDGFAKPDLVAPGKNIVARIVNMNMGLAGAHPANILPGGQYFRMSGTSVAAPIVSGAAALLLQDEPGLNPDQVKYRLMATANKSWAGYSAAKAGAGYLDVYAAVNGTTATAANTGQPASQLLWSGSSPVTWGSVNWNSVNWNSVNWNSVNWNSVNWNSVNWNSDYWGQ
jgi:serine protease AprX